MNKAKFSSEKCFLNVSEYETYMKNKQLAMARVERVNRQDEDINMLKQDVAQIKEMLTLLIKGKE